MKETTNTVYQVVLLHGTSTLHAARVGGHPNERGLMIGDVSRGIDNRFSMSVVIVGVRQQGSVYWPGAGEWYTSW